MAPSLHDAARALMNTVPPSERPTVKRVPADDSSAEVIELSSSVLRTDYGFDRDSETPLALPLWQRDAPRAVVAPAAPMTTGSRSLSRLVLVRKGCGYVGLGAIAVLFAAAPAGLGAIAERVSGVGGALAPARSAHQPASQHNPLAERAGDEPAPPPSRGCASAGTSRTLATTAQLAPGLDVSIASSGFGVGFAPSADEALGVRLDGSLLRVADRVHMRAPSSMKHVTVDGRHRNDDGIDLRVDADDARTVVPNGDARAFRIAATGGWIQILGKAKLWPVPGSSGSDRAERAERAVAVARTLEPEPRVVRLSAGFGKLDSASAAKARVAPDVMKSRDGFVKIGEPAQKTSGASAPVPDIRAAAREDGGAIIALRSPSPSALWLGLVDRHHAAEGALVALPRAGASIGMPAVAPWGRGGAVAWAERPAGDRDWVVMVASFGKGSDGKEQAPVLRPMGAGMSPSIAALPEGELLLVYAAGAPGAHRVVMRRLGRDLEPRGEPVAISPAETNAGQPVAAMGADGRGLVAFFADARGRTGSVLATPLACDVGR